MFARQLRIPREASMGPCPRGHGGVRNLVSGQSECGGLQWGRARAGTEGLDIETDGTADSYRFNGAVPARARRDARLMFSENSTLSLQWGRARAGTEG